MEGYRELHTWDEVWDNLGDVQVESARLPGMTLNATKNLTYRRIELRYGDTIIVINAETFSTLKPAFRFWVKDEPLEWKGEGTVTTPNGRFVLGLDGSAPSALCGKKVEVHIKEVR